MSLTTLTLSEIVSYFMTSGLILGQVIVALVGSYAVIVGLQLCSLPNQLRVLLSVVTFFDQMLKWWRPAVPGADVWREQWLLEIETSYLRAPDAPSVYTKELASITNRLDKCFSNRVEKIDKCWEYFQKTKQTKNHHPYPYDFSDDERMLVEWLRSEYMANKSLTYGHFNQFLCKKSRQMYKLLWKDINEKGPIGTVETWSLKNLDTQLVAASSNSIIQKIPENKSDSKNSYPSFIIMDAEDTIRTVRRYIACLQKLSGGDSTVLNNQSLGALAWSMKQLYERLHRMQYERQKRFVQENIPRPFVCTMTATLLGVFYAVHVPSIASGWLKALLGLAAVLIGCFSAHAVFKQASDLQRGEAGSGSREFFLNKVVHIGYRFCLGFVGVAQGYQCLFFYNTSMFFHIIKNISTSSYLLMGMCMLVGLASVYRSYLCTKSTLVRHINTNTRQRFGWQKARLQINKKLNVRLTVLRLLSVVSIRMFFNLALMAQCCTSLMLINNVTCSLSMALMAALTSGVVHYLEQRDKYEYLVSKLQTHYGVSGNDLVSENATELSKEDRESSVFKLSSGQRRRGSC